MTTRALLTAGGLLLLAAVVHARPVERELFRIRIANVRDGLVQVSADVGETYRAVGRVKTPANYRIVGFAAASYAAQGTVAATAVHGIRVKTGRFGQGPGKAQMPIIFSIVPIEFAAIPQGYGGHIPRSSGIITDIHAGRSIFRNLAPYAGSQVFIERDRALFPLPEDYTPAGGEAFVIVVQRFTDCPSEVEFENRVDGKVTARYPDGSSRAIARVERPAKGVGRYDGTTFTGVGSINTNHGGVITISTAPEMPPLTQEGGPVETRGGFMVQPNRHAREQGETAPQVMVIGPPPGSSQRLEGAPPLFGGCIGLSRYPARPADSYRAQVRIDGGDWRELPSLVGKIDDALASVTAIRLLFPKLDPKLIAEDIAKESADYTARALESGEKAAKGTIVLAPKRRPRGRAVVTFLVDAHVVYTSNERPFVFEWDTTRVPNGFHTIDIEIRRSDGGEPTTESRVILTQNSKLTTQN